MKKWYEHLHYVAGLLLLVGVFILILSPNAHAEGPLVNDQIVFYHGIDCFHSSTDFRSTTKKTVNFKSFGGSPFVGAHINKYLAIEGGYIYHQASSNFTVIGQKSTPRVIVGHKYSSVADEVAPVNAGYSIQGPHIGVRLTSPRHPLLPIRAYISVALFPSFIKVQFKDQSGKLGNELDYMLAPVELPKVFTRIAVGGIWDITPQISFRASLMVLRPERVDLSQYNNVMFKQLKHYTHISAGFHYNWN